MKSFPQHLTRTLIMLVAVSSTKIPIFLDKGFWAMAHETRTDWSMLLGSIFLLIVGAGAWSIDARMMRGWGIKSNGQKK